MRSPLRADLALVSVALAWGASFVVIKGALDLASPHWLLFLRFLVAVVALLVFFPRAARAMAGPGLRVGMVLGALLWASFALQTVGLVFTTPAKSAFLTATYVLMVPLLHRLLFGAHFTRPVTIGVTLAFAGLTLLARPTDLATLNLGDVLTVGCAVAFALHIVVLGRAAPRMEPAPLALLQMAVICAISLPAALAFESPGLVYPASFWIAVLFLGIACSAFAFAVQTWAQRHTLPSRVALIFSLEAVFAALLSVIVVGERLSPLEWLGGGLVLAGVLLAELTQAKSLAIPKASAG
jgi:drug/metabolite transporter (DMT)-like permease